MLQISRKSKQSAQRVGLMVGGAALADGHTEKAMAAAIDARKHQMQLIGYSMGVLGTMAKGDVAFDAGTATAAASNLAAIAKLVERAHHPPGHVAALFPMPRRVFDLGVDANLSSGRLIKPLKKSNLVFEGADPKDLVRSRVATGEHAFAGPFEPEHLNDD